MYLFLQTWITYLGSGSYAQLYKLDKLLNWPRKNKYFLDNNEFEQRYSPPH